MPPACPSHPGHHSGTAFFLVLPGPRGSGHLQTWKAGACRLTTAACWPTARLLRYSARPSLSPTQPKVGWEHSSASSCRLFRIPSFHELESLFKLTRASERRPSIAVYPCSTSAHLLLCVVDVTLLHADGYQPCCPCSHVHLELGGQGSFFFLFARSTHSTVLPPRSTWV